MFKKLVPALAALTLLFSLVPMQWASAAAGSIKVNNTGDPTEPSNNPKAACQTFFVVGTGWTGVNNVDIEIRSGGSPNWATVVHTVAGEPVNGGDFSAGPITGLNDGQYKITVTDTADPGNADAKVINLTCTRHDVTVTKTVTGPAPANDFVFNFVCPGIPDPADVTLSKNGDAVGVSRAVVEGISCTIEETNPQGATATTHKIGAAAPANGATTTSFVVNGDMTVTFANTYPVLNIVRASKTVTGARAPAAGTKFELCLDVAPPAGQNQCQDAAHGDTVSWTDLPDGTYTVTETTPAPTGAQSSAPTISYSPANQQVTVANGDDKTVAVTNAYGAFVTNTVRATKTVTGARAPAAGTKFELCLDVAPPVGQNQCQDAAHGDTVSWTDLPDGTYTVTETTPAPTGAQSSVPTITYSPAGGQVTVAVGQDKTVTVTNAYGAFVTNTVRAKKIVTGARAPAAGTKFELCLDVAPPVGQNQCQDAAHGDTVSWTDLPDGTYTVTETTPAPTGAQNAAPGVSYDPAGGQVTVAVGQDKTVEVTNAYGAFLSNTVRATKAVNGARAPAPGTLFEMCLDVAPPAGQNQCQDVADGGTVSWTDLPDGTYTVTETTPAPTGAQSSAPTISYSPAGGQVAVAVGQDKTVTVTNAYGAFINNTVRATKTVVGARAPAAGTKFELCLDVAPPVGQNQCQDAAHGDTVSWTDLPDGTYTVTETTPAPTGAQSSVPTITYSPAGGQVTVAVGQDKTVDVTNAYGAFINNTVRATKVVTGARAPAPGTQFEMCLSPAPPGPQTACQDVVGGGTVSWTDLPDDTYTVTETAPPAGGQGFVPTPAYSPAGGQVAVAVGDDKTVTVTNAYGQFDPGNVTITKTVSGNQAPSPGDYVVCLTPAVGAAQCKTLSRTGAGTVVDTWTGLAPGDWTLTETSATAGTNGAQPTTTITTPTITVTPAGSTTGGLTNDYGNSSGGGSVPLPTQLPSIEVTKTAAAPNPDIGGTISYTYLVQNTGNVTLSSVVLRDDKLGTITLSDASLAPGASTSVTASHVITAADLDRGSLRNVGTAEGVAPSGSRVTDTDTATVTFPARPSVTVDKTADRDSAEPGDLVTYTYVVTNTGNVTISDLSLFDDKIGTVLDAFAGTSLAAGESVTLTAVYTVTSDDSLNGFVENLAVVGGQPPRELAPLAAEDTVTLPVGETIVFDTGFLTVSKLVEGTHDDAGYRYDVDCGEIALGRAGTFGIAPRGGEHEVGVAVPVSTECTVTETDDGGADRTIVAVGDAAARRGRSATITVTEGTNLVTFTNIFEIAPIEGPGPTLPATGSNAMVQLAIGLAALTLGAALRRKARDGDEGWLRA